MEKNKKKEYVIPELEECSLIIEDVLFLSTGDNHDIFDFDDEL